MAPAIPDRWIPYKASGSVIEGTNIICFKVPLRKTVQTKNKDIKQIWDIETLLKTIPNLGFVIDLTNTTRYYNPKEFQAAGVLHKKILMPGRIIPPEKKVTEFINTLEEFLGKDHGVVGVHCTHGLNRTGYMVCRYMRDRLGIPADEAIKKFEKARGYQIERENYIADLLREVPPPPDIGKSTVIKPIYNKAEMKYQSPLNDCEDNISNSNSERRSRYGFNSYEQRQNVESWRSEGSSWRSDRRSWRHEGKPRGNEERNWRNEARRRFDDSSSRDRHQSSYNAEGPIRRK